jgi:threonine dehydratase
MNHDPDDWYRRVTQAHARIRDVIVETPVESTADVVPELAAPVIFKLEHLQRTGSFKLRGAANRIAVLTPAQVKAGVLASSMGNHGLGVAVAARAAGVSADVYLCQQVPEEKRERIRSQGAEVRVVGEDPLAAELAARRMSMVTGRPYISPYNDADVIAGQGTIAVELLRQVGKLDAVFVAVGGGGLISGVGAYLKSVSPQTQIVGCWPKNAPALYECLQRGTVVDVPEEPTLSESTAGGIEPGSVTLPLCQRVIDRSVLVTEDEIFSAMCRLRDARGWIVEGAAAVALAAFVRHAAEYAGKTVAIILCGGNLNPQVRERISRV